LDFCEFCRCRREYNFEHRLGKIFEIIFERNGYKIWKNLQKIIEKNRKNFRNKIRKNLRINLERISERNFRQKIRNNFRQKIRKKIF